MAPFHAFVDYSEDVRGIVVPQESFAARGQSSWTPLPNIQFRVNGTLGLRLKDALQYSAVHAIPGLQDRGERPVLSSTSIRVTMRILWPGYDSWVDANGIHQYDHGYLVNPRNREHIAWQVARSVKTFYDEQYATPGRALDWSLCSVSRGSIIPRISFDDLYLIELRHVSKGSWQPVLSWLPPTPQ